MTKIINYLQLKAARNTLDLGIREIAKLLRVSKSTVSNAELGKTRDFFFKHSAALCDFFLKNNIHFPNEYSIRYYHTIEIEYSEHLTRFQLKSARSILNISQLELATLIGIDKGVISRTELTKNFDFINPPNTAVNSKLKNLFQHRNIEFPDPFSIFFKKYIDK